MKDLYFKQGVYVTLTFLVVWGAFRPALAQLSGSGDGSSVGSGDDDGEVPTIIEHPQSISRVFGDTGSLTCVANLSDLLLFKWYKNGNLVDMDVNITEIEFLGEDRVKSELIITSLVLSDAGNYTCNVSNKYGFVISAEAMLTVLYPTNVTLTPEIPVVNQSSDAVLTCEAFGIPQPSINWFSNGSFDESDLSGDSMSGMDLSDFGTFLVNIVGEIEITYSYRTDSNGQTFTVSVLRVISVVKSDENVSFTCQGFNGVVNDINAIEDITVTITVQVPPTVSVVGSVFALGVVGSGVTLSFMITNAYPDVPRNNIKWTFNNGQNISDITGLTTNGFSFSMDLLSLSIVGISSRHEGNYTLTATNNAGNGQASIELEVEAGPVIVNAPENQEVIFGEDVVFSCTSTAEPLHSVVWTFDGSLIANYNATSDTKFLLMADKYSLEDPYSANFSSLTVHNVTLDDAGEYKCNVSNVHGEQQASAVLQVQLPPSATISSPFVSGFVGGIISFFCLVKAFPIPSITWFVNDTSIGQGNISTAGLVTNSTLTLNTLTLNDIGTYTCLAENTLAEMRQNISSPLLLEVFYPPNVTTIDPVEIIINQTQEAIFICHAYGIPVPNITWIKSRNGSIVTNISNTVEISESVISNTSTRESILTFVRGLKTDESVYTCKGSNGITNIIESPQEDNVTLLVQVPVEIENNPVNTIHYAGGTISLSCNASGIPLPTFKWFKNGVLLNATNRISFSNMTHFESATDSLVESTIVLTNLILSDDDDYHCEASNPGAYDTVFIVNSNTAHLTIQYPPNVTTIEPVEIIINQTQEAVFTCHAYGIPVPNITWIKSRNGSIVTNISNTIKISESVISNTSTRESILTFVRGLKTDESVYTCKGSNGITNIIESPQEDNVTLLVQVPVEIENNPINTTHYAGGTISLSCNASGIPLPTFKWFKNGVLLNATNRISFSNMTHFESATDSLVESTIVLTNLILSDDDDYNCEAINPGAYDTVFIVNSNTAHLTIQYPPNVTTIEPVEIIINQTQEAVFTCHAYGIPVPNITWIKSRNGSIVTNISNTIKISESVISNTSTRESILTFIRGLKTDESVYTCKGSNGITNIIESTQEDNVTLLVQVPVEIENNPVNTIHYAGGTISLSCNASGIPLPTFKWFKNGVLLNATNRISFSNMTHFESATDSLVESTIVLTNLILSDDDDYHCEASNPGAYDTVFIVNSNTAHLTIQYPPNVTTIEPVEIIINQTQEAVFTCHAYGIPVPNITWIKSRNGSIVTNISNTIKISESVISNTSTRESILTFVRGLKTDESVYTCKGSNGITNIIESPQEDNVTLLVQVPVEIENNPINTTHYAGGTISLSCNASGIPLPTFKWFKNGVLLNATNRISFSNMTHFESATDSLVESTIVLTNLILSDDDDYNCEASNPGAYDTVFIVNSNTAHLTIQYPPNVTVTPEQIIINSTVSYVKFTCYVFGIPSPLITWIKNRTGEVLTDVGFIDIDETSTYKSRTSILTVSIQGDRDESNYTCITVNNITNVLGTPETATSVLYVQDPAMITVGPMGGIYPAGRVISLICSATGLPVPNITWYKNDTLLVDDAIHIKIITIAFEYPTIDPEDGSVFSHLRIFGAVISDDADYLCRANNTGAPGNTFTVSSDPVHVTIEYPPMVSVEPSFLILNQSDTAVFYCTIFGIPTPSFTWINGSNELYTIHGVLTITNVTNGYNITSTLTIHNTQRTDMGKYTCRAENGITNLINSPMEDSVELFVQEPSQFLINPVNVTNYTAGSAVFSCLATGIPIPIITWFKNNTKLSSSGRLTIVNQLSVTLNEKNITSTLTITNLEISDTAFYLCETSNTGASVTFGDSSDKAYLSVQYPPQVSVTPLLTIVNETNTTSFTCKLFGIPTPNVIWSKTQNGQTSTLISNSTYGSNITTIVSGYNVTSVLLFSSPIHTDEAMYTCKGENNVFNAIDVNETSTVTLFVQVPALFIVHPESITNYTAGKAVFTCAVVGFPVPSIVWLKNGDLLKESNNVSITINSSYTDISGFSESVLTITDLILIDAATYRCVANNTGALGVTFIVFSVQAVLIVHYPPSLSISPTAETVNQTDQVSITCTVFAIPPPEITWTDDRDGTDITSQEEVIEITETDVDNTRTSVLTFLSIVKANESNYTCTAVNNVTNIINSVDVATSSLTVQVPATVTSLVGLTLFRSSGSNATLAFALSEDSPPVQTVNIHWFHHSLDSRVDITFSNDPRLFLSSDRLSLQITGIIDNDEGEYILEASNEAGIGRGFITISVRGRPAIIDGPKDQKHREGDVAVFRCFAIGDPHPVVHWIFNGSFIVFNTTKYSLAPVTDGNNFGSLTIYDLTYYDKGEYSCFAINNNGTSSTFSAILEIQVVPVIVVHPVTQAGIAGGIVALNCTAIGFPHPDIVWLKDGDIVDKQLIPDGTITVNNGRLPEDIVVISMLNISDLQLHDVANYTCNASNSLVELRFAIADEAALTVLYPPNVDVSPNSFTVNQTQPSNFTCTAFGIPLPVLTWYGSNLSAPLVRSNSLYFYDIVFQNESGLSLTESTLIFPSALRTDMSSYTCIAVNNIPNLLKTPENDTTILYVQIPALIYQSPIVRVEHFRGGITNISCNATGLPVPTVTWFKNEKTFSFPDHVFVVEKNKSDAVSGYIESTLVFATLELSDNASYYCQANNTGAPGNEFIVTSNSSFVFVTHPPNVTVSPVDKLTVNVTFTATLTCSVFAIPLPTITWIKVTNGRQVVKEGDRITITEIDSIHMRTSILNFTSTIKLDESPYECIAVNNITNVINTPENQTIDLVIQVPANVTPVTTSPVYGVEGRSVTLIFNITEDDPPVQVSNIRWQFSSTSGTIDITHSTDSHYDLSADRRSLTINQITSAHHGQYTLFATNEAGTRFNSTNLIVQGPPLLFRAPQSHIVLENTSVTFFCLAFAQPFPVVSWTYMNRKITPAEKYIIGSSGTLFGSLTIHNIKFEDRGLYTCNYTNEHGSIIRSAMLTVQVRPVINDLTVPDNGIAGDDIIMTCNSIGFPAPVISWLMNNFILTVTSGEISINTTNVLLETELCSVTSHLQVMGLVLSDTANYSCHAVNNLASLQTEQSDQLHLTVLYPPAVIVFPVTLTVNQTDEAIFTCQVFAIPHSLIQWFFNGSSIPLSHSDPGIVFNNFTSVNGSGQTIQYSNLTVVSAIRNLHEGSYICSASNNVTNYISSLQTGETQLTVQVPPIVVVMSVSPLGVVNQTVTLSFAIQNASPPVSLKNIKWTFNNTVINEGSIPSRFNFSSDLLSLTVSDLKHSDQGSYTLSAVNEAGTNSSAVFLEIQAAPVILIGPSNVSQLERYNISFQCSAIAEPIHTVGWFFEGISLSDDGDKYTVVPVSSLFYGTLTIHNLEVNDTGKYTCLVNNTHGSVSASAYLSVQVVPQFRRPPADKVQLIGENVTILCSAYAVPAPNITWLKNRVPIDLNIETITAVYSTEGHVTNSQLTILSLNFSDTGEYLCMASNNLVSVQTTNSSIATLTVNMPVIITSSPHNTTVNETDIIRFVCKAEGLPVPSFTWFYGPNQTNLSGRANNDLSLNISNTTEQLLGAVRVTSILTFSSIRDSDTGQYTCVASNVPKDNMMINKSASFSVLVQTKPVVTFTGNNDTVIGVEFRDVELTFNISRDLPSVVIKDIRWFFEQNINITRRPIENNHHYQFSENKLTLKLVNLSLSLDTGFYIVEASNIVGTGRDSVYLDIQKAPVIIRPLTPLIQLAGSTAEFTCSAVARPQHTTEWLKDNVQLSNSSKYQITGLGTPNSILNIFNLSLADSGNYTCIANNIHGNASTSDELFVQVPPEITVHPKPQFIIAGDSTVLFCNVTGYPRPLVDILKDNIPLNIETSSQGVLDNGVQYMSLSVSLYSLSYNDTANYSCNATNNLALLKTEISPQALYLVQYPPDVSLSPISLTVNETDMVSFICTVFAIPTPIIHWINDKSSYLPLSVDSNLNVTITDSTKDHPSRFPLYISNLTISSATKQHEGNYTCLAINNVTNLINTHENQTASLTVQVPPTIIPADTNPVGVVNRSINLTFVIERSSPEVLLDDIMWIFTNNIGESQQISNSSKRMFSSDYRTLTLTRIQHEDEGQYTLIASNPAGTNLATINLTVQAAPIFLQLPQASSRLQGETAVFNCSAVADPVHSIRWEKEGVTIAQYLSPQDKEYSISHFSRLFNSTQTGVNLTLNSTKYRLKGEGPLYGQLIILNVNLDDARNYTCVVGNVHEQLSASVSLTVQVTPTFPGKVDATIMASAGQNITLVCNTEGLPLPNVTWFKDGYEVEESENIIIWETKGDRNINSTLSLFNVILSDEGVYWCSAINFLFVLFETESPNTTLTVHYPPNVITGPTSLNRNASQYAVFTCLISGLPVPSIQWIRAMSSEPLSNVRRKFTITSKVVSTSETGPTFVSSTLVILNLTISDQHNYTCSGITPFNISNFIGARSNASATLFVRVSPRVFPVTSSPVIVLWNTSFTLSFTVTMSRPPITPSHITWEFISLSGVREILPRSNSDPHYAFSDDRRSLTLSSVRLNDTGQYILIANNDGGRALASIQIQEVQAQPYIGEVSGKALNVPLGGSVTFNCTVDGIPRPSLTWRRNGTLLMTGEGIRWLIMEQVIGERVRPELNSETVLSQLTLINVDASDDGSQITCRADNNVGEPTILLYIIRVEGITDPCSSNPCQNGATCSSRSDSTQSYVCVCGNKYTGTLCEYEALVYIPPTIITPPQPVSARLYTPVNLTCLVQGVPFPQIHWYKDGSEIRNEHASEYLLAELTVASRGYYHCTATSEYYTPAVTVSSDPVLVSITNIVQYLLTVAVSVSQLQKEFPQQTSEELQLLALVERMNDVLAGTALSTNASIYSFQINNFNSSDNTENSTLVFTMLVTVVLSVNQTYQLEEHLLETIIKAGTQFKPPFTVRHSTRFDGCVSEVTSSLSWPEINLGTTVFLACPCGGLSLGHGSPVAQRTCNGSFRLGAEWSPPNITQCNFNTQLQLLCNVTQLPTVQASLQSLHDLITTSPQDLTSLQLLIVIAGLESFLDDIAHNPNLTSSFLNVVESVLSANSTILIEAQQKFNVTARILLILERLAEVVPLEGKPERTFKQNLFVLKSIEFNRNTFHGSNFSGSQNSIEADTRIILPAEIALIINSTRLIHSLYFNNNITEILFSSSSNELISDVISASFSGISQVILQSPVNISFRYGNDTQARCVFWDFSKSSGRGDWSTDGCETIQSNISENLMYCFCFHLTHFALVRPAILMTTVPPVIATSKILSIFEIISVVGVVLSILCLVATLLTYLLSKKLRDKDYTPLLANLYIALILLYTVYIGTQYAESQEITCIVLSTFFHYTFLVVLVAILGEVIQLLFTTPIKYLVVYVMCLTWILPVLLVGFVVAPLNDHYTSDNLCRPDGILFLVGFVVPMASVIFIKFILYIILIVSHFKRELLQLSYKRTHFVQSFLLSVVFTVGWAAEFAKSFTSDTTSIILEGLFMATGATLGVYIFFIYCLSQLEVRNAWKQCYYKAMHRNYEEHDTPDIKAEKESNLKTPTKPVLEFQELYYPPGNGHDTTLNEIDTDIEEVHVNFNRSRLTSDSSDSTDLPVAKTPSQENIDSNTFDLPDPHEETAL